MHCWTATDARPGLPRVVRAAINVANSFKMSTCSWLLWGPRSRAQLSLPNGFLFMSIPAVATRLSTIHRRHISLIHFPSLMSMMICQVGQLSAWLPRVLIECAVFAGDHFFLLWSLLFGLLGLAPKGLDSSTVAHRLCTISAHDRSHTLLTNALYSSAPALRPYDDSKNSMWWCGQVLHFWYHHGKWCTTHLIFACMCLRLNHFSFCSLNKF